MKKTLAVLLAGILCAGMLAACGSSAPTSDQSSPAEAGTAAEAGAGEGRTFTVGFDAEYPPYGYMDENGEYTDVDFTKWFHDLYRPSLRPYDPRETELITRFCTRADKDFENRKK